MKYLNTSSTSRGSPVSGLTSMVGPKKLAKNNNFYYLFGSLKTLLGSQIFGMKVTVIVAPFFEKTT